MQTMSAPHIHAIVLKDTHDYLEKYKKYNPNIVFRVLDVGCGSGYLTACLADLINIENEGSKVVGIDIYKSLVQMTVKNLNKFDNLKPQLQSKKIKVVCGNGWDGYESDSPFHIIHVGATADKIPEKLYHQLEKGGGIFIPINGNYYVIEKTIKGEQKVWKKMGVRFVKLMNVDEIREKEKNIESTTLLELDECIDDTHPTKV